MVSFSKRVYKAVLSIPLGQVRSYKWVAQKAGSPQAVRAVGQVLKNNPYPLLIPCHRVVKENGCLGGYAFGGGKKKRALLNLEKKISEYIRRK